MVFLTGITGLVGSFVADLLCKNGYQIKALVRNVADCKVNYPNTTFVEGDLLDPLLLNDAIAGCEFVIHCAALISFSTNKINEMMLVNIEGTKNVVNAALANNVTKLIHLSSIAALGRDPKTILINENSQWVDSDYITNYAKSKYLAELEVWRGIEEGLSAIILNPSVVLGVGNWNKSSSKLFKYVFDEKPFFTKGNMNVVDVRDVAAITLKALTSTKTNQRYIVSNEVITYQSFFTALALRFHKKAPSILVKPWMAALAWRFEWLKALFTQKEPLVTKETAHQSRSSFVYVNDKVKLDFDHVFIPLQDTLDWACQAYLVK
jgi:dihydroflavonol-4-reductase